MNRSLLGKKPGQEQSARGDAEMEREGQKIHVIFNSTGLCASSCSEESFPESTRTYSGLNAEETMPTKAKAKEIQTLSGDPSMKMYT